MVSLRDHTLLLASTLVGFACASTYGFEPEPPMEASAPPETALEVAELPDGIEESANAEAPLEPLAEQVGSESAGAEAPPSSGFIPAAVDDYAYRSLWEDSPFGEPPVAAIEVAPPAPEEPQNLMLVGAMRMGNTSYVTILDTVSLERVLVSDRDPAGGKYELLGVDFDPGGSGSFQAQIRSQGRVQNLQFQKEQMMAMAVNTTPAEVEASGTPEDPREARRQAWREERERRARMQEGGQDGSAPPEGPPRRRIIRVEPVPGPSR